MIKCDACGGVWEKPIVVHGCAFVRIEQVAENWKLRALKAEAQLEIQEKYIKMLMAK